MNVITIICTILYSLMFFKIGIISISALNIIALIGTIILFIFGIISLVLSNIIKYVFEGKEDFSDIKASEKNKVLKIVLNIIYRKKYMHIFRVTNLIFSLYFTMWFSAAIWFYVIIFDLFLRQKFKNIENILSKNLIETL